MKDEKTIINVVMNIILASKMGLIKGWKNNARRFYSAKYNNLEIAIAEDYIDVRSYKDNFAINHHFVKPFPALKDFIDDLENKDIRKADKYVNFIITTYIDELVADTRKAIAYAQYELVLAKYGFTI